MQQQPTSTVPVFPCARCGKSALREEGVVALPGQQRLRFRCRDIHCLSGVYAETVAGAVQSWNRVTQGWVALPVLESIGRAVPDLHPQIQKAMQGHFEKVTNEQDQELHRGGG